MCGSITAVETFASGPFCSSTLPIFTTVPFSHGSMKNSSSSPLPLHFLGVSKSEKWPTRLSGASLQLVVAPELSWLQIRAQHHLNLLLAAETSEPVKLSASRSQLGGKASLFVLPLILFLPPSLRVVFDQPPLKHLPVCPFVSVCLWSFSVSAFCQKLMTVLVHLLHPFSFCTYVVYLSTPHKCDFCLRRLYVVVFFSFSVADRSVQIAVASLFMQAHFKLTGLCNAGWCGLSRTAASGPVRTKSLSMFFGAFICPHFHHIKLLWLSMLTDEYHIALMSEAKRCQTGYNWDKNGSQT